MNIVKTGTIQTLDNPALFMFFSTRSHLMMFGLRETGDPEIDNQTRLFGQDKDENWYYFIKGQWKPIYEFGYEYMENRPSYEQASFLGLQTSPTPFKSHVTDGGWFILGKESPRSLISSGGYALLRGLVWSFENSDVNFVPQQ